MKTKEPRERFPVSTALKPALWKRLCDLRRRKWRITQIFELGIKEAEKKN